MSAWIRRRNAPWPSLVVGFLIALGPLWPAWAGGIWLYEMATPDQGTAAAGRAALAVDASTAWLNPAGMTRLDRSQFLLGAGPIVLQNNFDVEPGTTTSGGGASLTSVLPIGSGFYVQNFTGAPDFKLGVSLTTLPGLAADYGETWAGRYFLEKAALFGVALRPPPPIASCRGCPSARAPRWGTRTCARIRPSTTAWMACPTACSRSGAMRSGSGAWWAS
jgi:hypothetical protein